MALKVSASRDFFTEDDGPFFYLADTVWMTFTHAGEDDWRAANTCGEALDRRCRAATRFLPSGS